jgi:hypothetical protein
VGLALASISACVAAVATARSVDLSAYTLGNGVMRDALMAAARAGARVHVRLEGAPLDDPRGALAAVNAATVATLAAAGADAQLAPAGTATLHLKAAVVDGVAWLADRNWAETGPQTLVRDSEPGDVATVSAGLRGEPAPNADLAVTKAAAQALELDVIARAGPTPLALESESFGSGAVAAALLARARAGAPTRLIVAGAEVAGNGPRGARERRLLAALAGSGVEVRTGRGGPDDLAEKIAVGEASAWVGSANATYAGGAAGAQRDWGLRTRDPALVADLHAVFERNWVIARHWTPPAQR